MNYWTPDLIKPSRVEEIQNYINAPKIEIGAKRPQLESK
jgi:hypothetical protein